MTPESIGDKVRQQRYRAEMRFRRGFVRVARFALLIIGFYFAVGLLVPKSTVLARSEYRHLLGHRTIVVRQVFDAPLWAWPVARLLEDSPQHRCEYYAYGSELWSCQSYTGDSYRAGSAQIAWDADGTATVSLDHSALFVCRNGWWTDFKPR